MARERSACLASASSAIEVNGDLYEVGLSLRVISILYIYKVAAFFDLCSPTAPWPLDLEGSSLDMFTSGIKGWFV